MKTTITKETKRPMIRHQENGITVLIPTESPAATHELLLKGISSLLRYYALSQNKIHADADGIAAVIDLQQALTPGEKELQAMNTPLGK